MTPATSALYMLDAVHDQPVAAEDARQLLFICTTPRSGSHSLCRALYDLGLGVPEEYFHPNAMAQLAARWAIPSDPASPQWFEAYWQRVQQQRNRNGIVAVSLFGYQTALLTRLLRPTDQPVFLHLHRLSATDQISSLIALYQTKKPYENDQQVPQIPDIGEISPRSIRILHKWLRMQNDKWCQFLADKPHLAMTSEELFSHSDKLLTRVVEHGQWPVPRDRIAQVATEVTRSQAYSVNAEIKRRLLAENAAAFAAIADEGQDGV